MTPSPFVWISTRPDLKSIVAGAWYTTARPSRPAVLPTVKVLPPDGSGFASDTTLDPSPSSSLVDRRSRNSSTANTQYDTPQTRPAAGSVANAVPPLQS